MWVRKIVEVIDDMHICKAYGGDHDVCLGMAVAASWPEPQRYHDLELEND